MKQYGIHPHYSSSSTLGISSENLEVIDQNLLPYELWHLLKDEQF